MSISVIQSDVRSLCMDRLGRGVGHPSRCTVGLLEILIISLGIQYMED